MSRLENEGVQEKLLALMYQQDIRATLPVFIVQLMITFLLYQTQPLNLILVWISVSLVYKNVHLISFTVIKKNSSIDVQKKLFLVSASMVIGSFILAGSLYFFNTMPIIDRIILTMSLLAVTSGANGAFAGDQRLYWCFTTPIMVPLTILWFANIPADINTLLSIWIGVLLIVVTVTVAIIGQDTFEFFSNSIKHMKEKDQLTTELMEALEQQELLKQNAERSNQSKTRLLAAVSHDLRQPVHVLNLFNEALKKKEFEQDSKHIINNMQLAISDLSQQIDMLLDITKLDEISYKPVIKDLRVSELVEMLSRSHLAAIDERGLKLIVHNSEDMWVMSDQQLLSQMIKNLIGNAIKYTSTGQITLSIKGEADDVLLSVEDTGIGIEETELATIFEEYYQVNNPERNHQNGLGLGLSIVERAADILEHTITAESTLGVGSKFTIRMKREYPQVPPTPHTSESFVTYQPNGVKLQVHVVDDDVMVCESMRSALEAMNCDVSTTHSTEATSEYFSNRSSPDLFVIDIRLQDEDSGYKTRQYAKAFHPQAKCVYISGEQNSDQQTRDIGDTQLIRKPVNGGQLEALLAETQSEVQSKISDEAIAK